VRGIGVSAALVTLSKQSWLTYLWSSKLHQVLAYIYGLIAVALLLMVACNDWSWEFGVQVYPGKRLAGGLGLLEAMIWASVLLRAGHGWYSIMARSTLALELEGHAPWMEVQALKQQSTALHRSLAETQWTIYRLEAQLQNLGVTVQRPHSHPDGCRSWGAMRVLVFSWLSSIVALLLFRRIHWFT